MSHIVQYSDPAHRAEVMALWRRELGYAQGHNEPGLVIDRKRALDDGLFFVALDDTDALAGTVMAGYDGHRGWLCSLAVRPEHRGAGLGSALVRHAEAALVRLGCVKVNLQVLAGNEAVCAFYEALGYTVEPRVSMGKRVPENLPPPG